MASKKKSKRKAKKKAKAKRKSRKAPDGIAPTTKRAYPKLDDRRDAKGRWLSGNCANPIGRGAQKPPLFDWLCAALAKLDPETGRPRGQVMVDKFVEMANGATPKDQDKLRAIVDILDRMCGKPTQHIEADVRRSDWWAAIPDERLRQIALGKMTPPEGMEGE